MHQKRFIFVILLLFMIALLAGTVFAATVDWKGVTWSDSLGTIAVNGGGNLEVTSSTCDWRCRGAASYSTPPDFSSSSTPWVEVTFTDLGPDLAGGQLWLQGGDYGQPGTNGAWTQFGAWQDKDTYQIYWWDFATDDTGFVDLGIDRWSGEHRLLLGMRADGTVDYCLNGMLVHTADNINPNSFDDIYLAAHSDVSHPNETVTFTNYRTGTDYMSGFNCNDEPVTSDVEASPNPASVDSEVEVTALVDDNLSGGSNIASAEYKLNADPWAAMSAQDGSFDDASEIVAATFTAPGASGIYNLCVRGTDEAGYTGEPSCTNLVVYNPVGGFVTGRGWIDSPECTYMPGLCPEGENFFLETFDENPLLANTATPGAWYPDRYPPSLFESAYFDGDNRLHVGIDAGDYDPYGTSSDFYNFQGRKHDLDNGINTYITADLYIGPDWETNNRHASIWTTAFDADGNFAGNPIVGFTAFDSITGLPGGFGVLTRDLNQDPNCDPCILGWHNIGFPTGFAYGQWYTIRAELSSDAYRYYINDELVFEDVVTFDSVVWGKLMLQAQNYGEDYDIYWDNVAAGPVDISGRVDFDFVSKYKRGATAPTGKTKFVFQTADLNFRSSSYDWLVVTGNNYANYKGEGTINKMMAPNGDPYKFQIWAGDGTGSGGEDTFRIKIWYEEGGEVVVYDNGVNQTIGDGKIVVHSGKKK